MYKTEKRQYKTLFLIVKCKFWTFLLPLSYWLLNIITKTKKKGFQEGFFVIINYPRSRCSQRMTRCVLLITWQNLQTLKDHLLFCETEKSQLWQSFLRQFDGVMNLYTNEENISDLSGNHFLKVKELCRSLQHLQVQKTTEVALSELCSFLQSVFASVLRCMTVRSLSCGRFPYKENVVTEWVDHLYYGETQKQIRE